jgi:hypothetical protein
MITVPSLSRKRRGAFTGVGGRRFWGGGNFFFTEVSEMSRAFVREDDGLIDFIDRERARKEREERLALLEKKIAYLMGDESADMDPRKKEVFLERLRQEQGEVEKLLVEEQ